MDNYLNGIKAAILLRKADCKRARDELYASARQEAHQFLRENAVRDDDFLEQLFLLEASIDEVENTLSAQGSVRRNIQQAHQLAA